MIDRFLLYEGFLMLSETFTGVVKLISQLGCSEELNMKSKYQKDLKLLMRKNSDRCSICKLPYDDDCAVFTCIGYDSQRKLQQTTKCCADKIVEIKSIGVCGYLDPNEDFGEIIKNHPMYSDVYKPKSKSSKIKDIVTI